MAPEPSQEDIGVGRPVDLPGLAGTSEAVSRLLKDARLITICNVTVVSLLSFIMALSS